ncbi:MAG: transglutaminase family protein [Bacteroidia bacterium]|nr:transglutaminase family protein [Bacteroidia bacterium]
MKNNEIDALIRLLDDTDKEVFVHIEKRLIEIGQEAIPVLENAWGHSLDLILQQRIENIIHKIQLEQLTQDLKIWYEKDNDNLLNGALIIARYQYPDLNESKVHKKIEKIRRDVWIELNDNLTALEQVKVINHVFFTMHGFSGNTQNYHAPQNSFINNVLETKKGNPLSLAILYSEIARSVGVPVYGVNLPEHFILVYKDKGSILPVNADEKNPRLLFYVNPFSKGSVFGPKEIDNFLKQLKLKPEKLFYEPCSNADILQRMIRNLIFSYTKLGHDDKVEELENLLKALGD